MPTPAVAPRAFPLPLVLALVLSLSDDLALYRAQCDPVRVRGIRDAGAGCRRRLDWLIQRRLPNYHSPFWLM